MSEIRVLVGAPNFDGATRFYGDVLGFPVQEHWDAPDGRGTLFRCASEGVIEIFEDSPHHRAETPRGVKVAVEVDDVDALYDRVRQADIEVIDPIDDRPWGHRNFEIHDPSGLPLVFFTARESR
jgi:catechol 2,3-dioxygenase-like lactoylglutathione lyase family enzyme